MHRALPMSIRTMAILIVQLRPKTSAIWAQHGMNAVDGRLKAETIQLSWENSPKSPAIQGRALAILRNDERLGSGLGVMMAYMVASSACNA